MNVILDRIKERQEILEGMHELMEHLEKQPELLQEIDRKIGDMEERIKRAIQQQQPQGGGGAAEEAAVEAPSAEEVKQIVTGAVAFGTNEIVERLNQLEVRFDLHHPYVYPLASGSH